MEKDTIVEGFSKAEEMYGLCYTTFIGDGVIGLSMLV
jgi:hypothetical protein